MEEIWKDIEGYEGKYQVSNLGNVKSLNYNKTGKERLLAPTLARGGYLKVELCNGNTRKSFRVHRLVAQAFIKNPSNKPCIDHINTIRTDNIVENLRWVTRKENMNNPITAERNKLSHIGQVPVNRKKIFCDGVIYNSLKECATFYSIKQPTMCAWLTGQNKMPVDFQAKGLRYYIEEEW